MRTPRRSRIALLSLLAAFAVPAAAQFKWIGPNGAVTYSDLPPTDGSKAVSMQAVRTSTPETVPAALRQAASKYPTVLYTTTECGPCQQARAHLERRGIPFAERTVRTSADADAFKRVGFAENTFPAVTVGRERSIGFEAGEWDRMLDLAGYPKTSMLPPSYRQSPAQPLAAKAPVRTDVNDAGGVLTAETADARPGEAAPRDDAAVAARQRGVIPPPGSSGAPAPRGTVSVRF
jgi:glutaredoxin